jgi:hypothetical protein
LLILFVLLILIWLGVENGIWGWSVEICDDCCCDSCGYNCRVLRPLLIDTNGVFGLELMYVVDCRVSLECKGEDLVKIVRFWWTFGACWLVKRVVNKVIMIRNNGGYKWGWDWQSAGKNLEFKQLLSRYIHDSSSWEVVKMFIIGLWWIWKSLNREIRWKKGYF